MSILKSGLVFFTILLFVCGCSKMIEKKSLTNLTWTYTYIKAQKGKRTELKQILIKNWFVIDSIAVKNGLFKDYELIDNLDRTESAEWDYIVAVEYFTQNTYSDISEEFEKIRKAHQTVKVNGLTFGQAGRIIKSELVKKS